MMPTATGEQIGRWASRNRDCTGGVDVESTEHARYLLGAHAGHGGSCLPYQDALRAVSVVCG